MPQEKWLDPWDEVFLSHSRPVREAKKSKDSQRTLQTIREHLPAMIDVRNEVAALPLPDGFRPGILTMIFDKILGMKNGVRLEAERNGTLQAWDSTIGEFQRDLRKLESGRR